MELKADLWFPSIVFAGVNEDVNREFIKIQTAQFRNAGTPQENTDFEWRSDKLSDWTKLDLEPKLMWTSVQAELDKAVEYACKTLGLPTLEFQHLWINVNGEGVGHSLHNHPGSLISGMYYVDVPEEDMGDVQFIRNDEAKYFLPEANLEKFNNITTLLATYKPITGLMLLFPSWINHTTTSNKSKKQRISISFKYGVGR